MKEKPIIDDSQHDILYISPGAHRGGFGRTYDWHAVTSDAQRKVLEERGYSPTLEHAFAVADAKKAGKEAPAFVPEERDPISGEVLAASSGPSLDDVKAALTKLKDAKDAKAVTALLKPFDVATAAKLKPKQYAEVIAAAEAAAAKKE